MAPRRRRGPVPGPGPVGPPQAARRRCAALDLEDLLLLELAQALDLIDPVIGPALERLEGAPPFVGLDRAVLLPLADLVGRLPTMVADLDPGLLHALVDTPHEVPPPLLGEGRDVQPDDVPVDVRHEPQVALEERLLDGPQDGPIPGLDDHLVRLRHTQP